MPIDANRHGPEGAERLPGDHGGPIAWVCPACETPQIGRPEDGCPACGAGKPGTIGEVPPSPPLESLGAFPPVPTAPVSGIAEKLAQSMRKPASSLEDIRQVVREELRAALSGPSFSEKERAAILAGLSVLQLNYEVLDDAEKATLPSVEEIGALCGRIQEGS